MEEIKGIVLSSDELLAAMVYYFSEIDPIDYTLLSDYVVGELKKKYPDQTIRIEGQKGCYSSIFEFYDHGNNNYEQIFCISDKKRRDKLFWDSRDGKSVWLLKYDKDENGRRKDKILLAQEEYREALKQVHFYDWECQKQIFNILSCFKKQEAKDTYYKFKARRKEEAREKIPDLNILLFSDDPRDYQVLVNSGFKNINCFKSIILAKKYFYEHPKELENYHIVIFGHQDYDTFFDCSHKDDPDIAFTKEIKDLCIGKPYFYCFHLTHGTTPENDNKFGMFAPHIGIRTEPGIWQEFVFTPLLDEHYITQEEFIEGLLKYLVVKFPDMNIPRLDFKEIKEYVNPEKRPIPKKISDIRILTYSDPTGLKDKYGLNITTWNDIKGINKDGPGFNAYLKEHLGDFDIIIVDDNTPIKGRECYEQSKVTGTPLVLLAQYHSFDNSYPLINEKGKYDSKIRYNYSYSGINESDFSGKEYVFRVMHSKMDDPSESNFNIEHAIRGTLYLYNQALINKGYEPIELPFTSCEELYAEYKRFRDECWAEYEANQERERKNLELIDDYDKAKHYLNEYLERLGRYQNTKIIREYPNGLNIYNDPKTEEIVVEFLLTGSDRLLGIMRFNIDDLEKGIRKFRIETINRKNGMLNSPVEVGFYKSEIDGKEGVPRRPNDDEMKLISKVMERIECELSQVIKFWDERAIFYSHRRIRNKK